MCQQQRLESTTGVAVDGGGNLYIATTKQLGAEA